MTKGIYNQTEMLDIICKELIKGISLREICRMEGMPDEATVRHWADINFEGFGERYLRARHIGAYTILDEISEIADDGRNDWMLRNGPDKPEWVFNAGNLKRARLMVDTRKWYLSKIMPKIFGVNITTLSDVERKRQKQALIQQESGTVEINPQSE